MNLFLIAKKHVLRTLIGIVILLIIPVTLFLLQSSKDIRQNASFEEQIASSSASLRGYVYNDADGNAIFSSGESGTSNITLHLLKSDSSIYLTTKTDETGYYHFENLRLDRFKLVVIPRDGIILTTLSELEINTSHLDEAIIYNFAVQDKSKTSNLDLNANGHLDKGDVAIAIDCIKFKINCHNSDSVDFQKNGVLDGADLNIILREYDNSTQKTPN